MKVRGYKKFVSVLAEIKVGKMTTLRHQIANLQPKKFALCFFPLDNSLWKMQDVANKKRGSARRYDGECVLG